MAGWARQINASNEQASVVIAELVNMRICDTVTEGNGELTLKNRRMVKEEKERILTRSRVERHRKRKGKRKCNANVTPPSSSSSSSSSSKKKERPCPARARPVPDGRVKAFIDFWYEKFKTRFGSPYVISGEKEGALVKKMLSVLDLEELQALAENFFDSDDEWVRKSGFTLGAFFSQINKLAAQRHRGGAKKSPIIAGAEKWLQMMEEEGNERGGQKPLRLADGKAGNRAPDEGR
jgi:hypothetical protein